MDYKTISPTNNIIQDFSKICRSKEEDKEKKILFFIKNIQQIFLRKSINDSNQTALLYFIKEEQFDIALKLVKIDTNYDIQDKDGNTPLLLISGFDHDITVRIARELLKGNCLIEHKNKYKENIIIACSNYYTIPSLKILHMVLDIIEEKQLDINIVFQTDKNDKSCLDYLIDGLIASKTKKPEEEWNEKLHIKTIIRIFNIYKDTNQYDKYFNNIIKRVCEDDLLYTIFEKPFDLAQFCIAPENAEAVIPMAEISSAPYRKSIKRASVKPIAIAEPITPEHTNANGHFAIGREHLYERMEKITSGGRYTRKNRKNNYK